VNVIMTGEQQRLRDYEATQKLIVSDHGEAKTSEPLPESAPEFKNGFKQAWS
jgi:hypothetical protein